ncbi:MAG: beta-N-acetylhexosaminidase, partial [Pseudomonadota bacterium]
RIVLQQNAVGGVILFARNFESPEQVSALCSEIRAVRSPELLIAVDQEGGRVQRFQDGMTRLPPMRQFGRQYEENAAAAIASAREAAWLLAAELLAVGVDFSFTPVLDLDWGVSEVIGDRAFHRDPEIVAELGVAVTRGLRDAGMPAIAKHFPGHGAVVADSHLDLPVDRRALDELATDIRPFERLVDEGVNGIMSAHIVYSACDRLPATFSNWWMSEYLRKRMAFKGAIFSDDLTMKATRSIGSPSECALKALSAGCDMVLVCNNRPVAEQVAETLKNWVQPTSQVRLASMRAKPGVSLAELRESSRWRTAAAEIAASQRAPEFSLDA